MKCKTLLFSALCLCVIACVCPAVVAADVPEFLKIAPIFAKHCVGCHGADDQEGEFRLDTFAHLMKGGETGKAIIPGKSGESLLVKLIESNDKNKMPPKKRKKLDSKEIALIRSWIDAGAPAPQNVDAPIPLAEIPKIEPKVKPQNGIYALAHSTAAKVIAVGRHGEVELRSAESFSVARKLTGHRGNVNSLAFTGDGTKLVSVSGETGVAGEAKLWNVADGALIRSFEGHRDALYSVALSPDGKTLATGSYDQTIKLWDAATGAERKTLTGHNGAVFSLSFRPDGKVLASASLDRTVKLWNVESGARLDTLSQSLKELYAVTFSPDGKRLAAGGVDSRIRVWQISETAADGTNPLLYSIFAHDGAILRLAYSAEGDTLITTAEDSTVKVWSAEAVTQKLTFEKQPDWVAGLAVIDKKTVAVGRMNGTFATYDAETGKSPKPELNAAEPPGVQRGAATKIKLLGKNLLGVSAVKVSNPKVSASLLPENAAHDQLWISLSTPADSPREKVELSVTSAGGESAKLAVYIDDLPQLSEVEGEASGIQTLNLPVSVWGTLKDTGDEDRFSVQARAGQTIIADVSSSSVGSKAAPVVTLWDEQGGEVIGRNEFIAMPEPLMAFSIPRDGRYILRVRDGILGGSKTHTYRMSVGMFQYVSSFYPLSARIGAETEISLFGYNLPAGTKVKVKPEREGDLPLPIDRTVFRSRSELKLAASTLSETQETEPNNSVQQAQSVPAPVSIAGRIYSAEQKEDADYFKFDAKAGQSFIIETLAAQRGSPVDTRIDIYHADGKPVQRLVLQAVRDSYINFRAIDSNGQGVRLKNWEEMELNEYVYLQGEVVKLFRAPQGPDSDSLLYPSPGTGRRCYFDTSPSAHANDTTCYIVEPRQLGEKLVPNGLPVFPLNFMNDDDSERKMGTDSKVHFTAPSDGSYVVRVIDTRGFSGERFIYRLVIREPKPDFSVSVKGENPTVNAGSGKSFSVRADRFDGFDGDIRVDITGLPPGFTVSTPLVIQAGHLEAFGTLNAADDAAAPTDANAMLSKLKATATINGAQVTKEAGSLGRIKLEGKPKVFVMLEPYVPPEKAGGPPAPPGTMPEITIAPGQTIPVWLKVVRNGHADLLTFSVDNLPHGVIVDNIGLNGVLIEKGLSERQIFLTAAKWVPETERICYAVENQAGRQTSRPLLLRVKKAK